VKVKTWVEFEQEVEVDVSMADFMSAIEELADTDKVPMLLDSVSRCYSLLKNIRTEYIGQMTNKQREIIANALQEQANRFRLTIPTAPTTETPA
jgi:GTP1/Obg family GTP-binding protein